jgi:hypothetical protein
MFSLSDDTKSELNLKSMARIETSFPRIKEKNNLKLYNSNLMTQKNYLFNEIPKKCLNIFLYLHIHLKSVQILIKNVESEFDVLNFLKNRINMVGIQKKQ